MLVSGSERRRVSRLLMIFHRYVPRPPLADLVDFFWHYDGFYPDHAREHVLPDGTFELVINLRNDARTLFGRGGRGSDQSFRRGWLSGTHSQYIVIDALPNSSMMGAHFKPSGIAGLLEFPAVELRDQVVNLDSIWGLHAEELREQLLAASGAKARFAILEKFLLSRLARGASRVKDRRRVKWAVDRFMAEPHLQPIRAVAHDLGVSHKHFIAEFRRAVGLSPKLFCRVRRFQAVLARINACQPIDWADLACACGYYDQAHFVNDFKAFSGFNPSGYLRQRADGSNFVPVSRPGKADG